MEPRPDCRLQTAEGLLTLSEVAENRFDMMDFQPFQILSCGGEGLITLRDGMIENDN